MKVKVNTVEYEEVNKEWKELLKNYRMFGNSTFEFKLLHHYRFDSFSENTMIYLFSETNSRNFVIEDYKSNGFKISEFGIEDSIREWCMDYWSDMEITEDMFEKSDIETKKEIIRIFRESMMVHFDFHSNSYDNYEWVKNQLKSRCNE